MNRPSRLTALAAALAATTPAFATNGMNMEGYGPISTGMGGASQAIAHGTAALAQNPATLALDDGATRLDVALGHLGPRVESRIPGQASKSDGTAYTMPALGYARRSGALTYGIGVFAQGGMGTEYGGDSFLAAGSGRPVRSELGVGRVMLPLAWQVTPEFALGATLDYMWAGLDLRMAAPATQLAGLVTGGSGQLPAALGQLIPSLPPNAWGRIDFSNSNDFTGAARSTGWAGKLGAVWRASPSLTLGGSYQLKSSLGDMKTSSSGATLSLLTQGGPFPIPGRITVVDFQWPAMTALGLAWQASPALLVAADVKSIAWSGVMKDFRMRFDSAGGQAPTGTLNFALPQDWKDQTVLNLGVAWNASPAVVLRAGLNLADNPIPDRTVNPLFPATVEKHVTAGFGWRFTPASELNGSLTVAPTTTVKRPDGIEISHRQLNAQVMYTHRF